MAIENNLWVEKYRPSCVEDCVLPENIKGVFRSFIKEGEILNLMLTGTQGTGKTSIAKAICKDLDADVLFIDASSEGGKQAIIDKIVPFASTVSIDKSARQKVVILDESDGLSSQAQQALRPNIEALSGVCRFIMTANYPAKIIPALKSRCKCFDFSYTQEQKKELMVGFYKRCAHILEDNSVPFDKKLLAQFISTNFPDFRSIVNTLQTCAQTHGEINESILTASSSEIASVVYPAILSKNFDTMRKVIHELSYSSNDVFSALFERLDEYIKENHHKPAVICILADYQDKASRVAIPELNLVACCVEIASVL